MSDTKGLEDQILALSEKYGWGPEDHEHPNRKTLRRPQGQVVLGEQSYELRATWKLPARVGIRGERRGKLFPVAPKLPEGVGIDVLVECLPSPENQKANGNFNTHIEGVNFVGRMHARILLIYRGAQISSLRGCRFMLSQDGVESERQALAEGNHIEDALACVYTAAGCRNLEVSNNDFTGWYKAFTGSAPGCVYRGLVISRVSGGVSGQNNNFLHLDRGIVIHGSNCVDLAGSYFEQVDHCVTISGKSGGNRLTSVTAYNCGEMVFDLEGSQGGNYLHGTVIKSKKRPKFIDRDGNVHDLPGSGRWSGAAGFQFGFEV